MTPDAATATAQDCTAYLPTEAEQRRAAAEARKAARRAGPGLPGIEVTP